MFRRGGYCEFYLDVTFSDGFISLKLAFIKIKRIIYLEINHLNTMSILRRDEITCFRVIAHASIHSPFPNSGSP